MQAKEACMYLDGMNKVVSLEAIFQLTNAGQERPFKPREKAFAQVLPKLAESSKFKSSDVNEELVNNLVNLQGGASGA